MNAVEKARESDELTEVEGKDGLFIVDELTPDKLQGQGYYLDLRDGFGFYGYTDTGDPIRGEEKAEPPTIVKEIESHYMAEGTQKLGKFVKAGDAGE